MYQVVINVIVCWIVRVFQGLLGGIAGHADNGGTLLTGEPARKPRRFGSDLDPVAGSTVRVNPPGTPAVNERVTLLGHGSFSRLI